MHHQAQNCFHGIFVVISQHPKDYLVYEPGTRKIISSYGVVFDENVFCMLAYTLQPYAEALDMRPSVSYTPYDTSLKEQTGNIIKFTEFEEGNLLSETRDNA